MRAIARYKQADRRLGAGAQLFRSGEPCQEIFELLEGWAFLYTLFPDGRRQILSFILPGAVVGFHPAQDTITTYGMEALTEIVVTSYRITARHLFEKHPEVGMRLAWELSRDLRLAFDHMASMGRLSAQERVAHLLLQLFVRYRMRWPGHQIEDLRLPLTQEHIGDATGLTGVHVNRVLRNLNKEEILEFHYRHLRILDPDRLMELASVDPAALQSWIVPGPPG